MEKEPKFFSNMLSLLEFNKRVVAQALNKNVPILERLKFLCIASSNLDEFFEIKVAILRRQILSKSQKIGRDGYSHEERFKVTRRKVRSILDTQYGILQKSVFSALRRKNIVFLRRRELDLKQKEWVSKFFDSRILPILTPVGLDSNKPGLSSRHPFPKVQNKSLNFMVKLSGKTAYGRSSQMAVVTAPRVLPRFVELPKELSKQKKCFMFLSSIIHENISKLFPGLKIRGCHQFRVTMNSNLEIDDEDLRDFKQSISLQLPDRKYNEAIRLEVVKDCPADIIKFLKAQYQLNDNDVYKVNGPVNLNRLVDFGKKIDDDSLKYKTYTPDGNFTLKGKSEEIFKQIKSEEFLLHHPYNSYDSVVNFLKAAVEDENVLAIKQTIYRTEKNSQIVKNLIDGVKKGKQVTAVIELSAKFDETHNIDISQKLEANGVQVTYGIIGLKTHAKAILVVRKEGKFLQRYAHLGTGNYNKKTASAYTDFGYITADKDITEDIHNFFIQLTGSSKKTKYKKIYVSPFDLGKKIKNKINREIMLAKKGKPALIMAKMNQLTESKIIEKLYEASKAGVKIDLFIRGECILKPGIQGLSENIRVFSTIGKFLEHTRAFYFFNNGKKDVYLSSADWMPRNIHNRIELMFPIKKDSFKNRIIKECFDMHLRDNYSLWQLDKNGNYKKRNIGKGRKKVSAQSILCNEHGDYL